MSRYQGRHSARHAAPARPRPSTSALTALRRPAVSGSLALVVLGTGAAGYSSADSGATAAASLTVGTEARAQSVEATELGTADATRLATDRSAALAAANINAAKVQEQARVRAAAVAAARKAAAERAAREAERKRLLDDAVADPRSAARALLGEFGFGDGQWGCLEQLWVGESGWNYQAENSSSGAYGIPQSLPGSKMASFGDDWRTNPVTQIRWGLDYIKKSYGTPCNALDLWNSRYPHWY